MVVDRHRMRAIQLSSDVGLLHGIVPEVAALNAETDDPQWARTLHRLDRLEQVSADQACQLRGRGVPLVSRLYEQHALPRLLRLGGRQKKRGYRGRAHPLGMELLATLASAFGETPYDVVQRHPT